VPDVVGKDEKQFGDVEGLPRAEQHLGELRREERARIPAGSV